MKVYDNAFNGNEWFTLIIFIGGYAVLFLLPRRFPLQDTFLYVLSGMFIGNFYDHTISIDPWNFYDVNDKSSFEFIDFISYFMYGPFAYYFVYFWDKLNAAPKHIPAYILCWSLFSMLLEYIGHLLGVYHYSKGYRIFYSFSVYPAMQGLIFLLYYFLLHEKKKNAKTGRVG
ncbi:hypothetical protein [Falsibacillus pallidus]|uniref:Uncharacterized protein n=1 Tax=Falsibacillus pallidus TaxID=493781 RepID=A0A370GZ42_9BACI|nr:hypothetical protein [Falsibacillus pallidus]RDI47924.1 hypothetical protein DFR59_101590 [Falsibacillus pallidus]